MEEKNIKRQSVKKNFAFQFIYQAITLVFPLVISPYLTRTLGDTGLGVYSFANSIAYYFVLFANLGIAKHGQRIIAQVRQDSVKLRKLFWSLFFLHALLSFLSLLLYLAFVLVFAREDTSIFLILGLYVASALFDITWFFHGLENFRSVVIRNAIVKVLECVLIFLFVKTAGDLWVYALITCGSILFGYLLLIPMALRVAKPIKFGKEDLRIHIKPMLVFSVSVIAVTLYTVFDKTLLGLMATKEDVAYYEYANKIIALPRTFVAIISTVVFPRACAMAEAGDIEGQKKYLNISLLTVGFMGFASLFGFLGVARSFSVIYYGESFAKSGEAMMAMCSLPLIIGLGEVVRSQYLIPNGMDKEYVLSIIVCAVINVALSTLLIPFLGIYGAIIGTCSAELIGCVLQIFFCRRFVSTKNILIKLLPFAVMGLIMFGGIELLKCFLDESILALLVEIFSGAALYCLMALLYVFLFEKSVWSSIKKMAFPGGRNLERK